MSDHGGLHAFIQGRGIFEVGGVSFTVTHLTYDDPWSTSAGLDGQAFYSHGHQRVELRAVSVELARPFVPAPPRPKRPPLMRWASCPAGKPWIQ